METELIQIQERNKRVELDKAWEVSFTRRAIIAGITYLCATALLIKIGNSSPFQNALLPVAGYLLSTLSLSFVKEWWTQTKSQ
jgi:hypothetical protein